MVAAKQKNFKYGDLWPGTAPRPGQRGEGRVRADPSKFINNRAFLSWIKENGFKLYLDYETEKIAYTTPMAREIVVNANYPDSMLGTLIQHELGHLMLFNASQFVSVSDPTMRSIVSKVLYTPDNLRDYGLAKLLKAENYIEDIIIETVSERSCVCHDTLELNGVRAGVKHLDSLESVALIAKEVCGNLLKEPLTDEAKALSYIGIGGHIRSMIQELRFDIEEIDEKLLKIHQDKGYLNRRVWERVREISKLKDQIEKLQRKLERIESEKVERLKNRLEAKLRVLSSKERERHDEDEAEAERGRALAHFQKKRSASAELLALLESELTFVLDGDGEGEGGDDERLVGNKTDHLLPDSDEDVNPDRKGHSFDCGFPHPVTIDRSESRKLNSERNPLKRLSNKTRIAKLKLQEDELDNIISNRRKLPESEHTYFRSSKREWDETDMLKGKKRKRASGVNVLVGLDISGSMSNEWTRQFEKLSGMVEEFQEKLEIDSIVYFTYNHRLVEKSANIKDLRLKPSGGNAFAHVYQQLMRELPIMQKNEIILVTDCGDNLGFKLTDVCVAERNGVEVQNHISIVDTEEAAFYDTSSLNEKDWSLYRAADEDLYENLRGSISQLIDS